MLDADRIKDAALRRLWEDGDGSKVGAKRERKARRILNALDVAVSPQELDIPGFGFHSLKGDRRETYAVWLTRNHRVTFRWSVIGPYDVQMEDYHGS